MDRSRLLDHAVLIAGALVMALPVAVAVASSILDAMTAAGPDWANALVEAGRTAIAGEDGPVPGASGARMMANSALFAVGLAAIRVAVALLAAYALVWLRLPFARLLFGVVVFTLLLPIEVRMGATADIAARLGLADSYAGLALPLAGSALATLMFRQFLRSVPDDLVDAARLDGAGPIGFFVDMLLPLSRGIVAAVFIVMLVDGWNRYVWPVLITTDERLFTLPRGMREFAVASAAAGGGPDPTIIMAIVLLAIVPTVALVTLVARQGVRALMVLWR